MNDYLELPWSMEDTIENMKNLRDALMYQLKRTNHEGKGYSDAKEIKFDFERAISALQQQLTNRWISVDSRLPEREKIVLQVTIVRTKDNYKWVQNLLWNYDEWKWWEEDEEKIDENAFKVIAWQPLPPEYKEVSHDAARS